MREPEFVPMQCPACGSYHYTILSVKIDNNGHFSKSIICANKKCRQNIGQLEPNSVVTNLRNINNTLTQLTDALKKIKPELNIGNSYEKPLQDPIEQDANKNKFPAYPPSDAVPTQDKTEIPDKADKADKADYSTLPDKKQTGAIPSEEPGSADPEADQSLE